MVAVGKIFGLVTILMVIGQVLGGLFRARIGEKFKTYHPYGGYLLGVVAATHGTLLFLGWGPPRSAWHFCGTFGATFVFIALVAAIFRAKLGDKFLKVHPGAAIIGLVLALLHRILPFI